MDYKSSLHSPSTFNDSMCYPQIDSCPIEGFKADDYNAILDLNNRHMNAAVIAAVGYRSDSDLTQEQKSKKIVVFTF